MRLCFVGSSCGVHEKRFLAGFEARGIETRFVTIAAAQEQPSVLDGTGYDLILLGPLDSAAVLAAHLDGRVPFLCLSYAYDLLCGPGPDDDHNRGVAELLRNSRGLIADCPKVIDAATAGFAAIGRSITRPWGLDRTARLPLPARARSTLDGWRQQQATVVVSTRSFGELYRVPAVVDGFALAQQDRPMLRLALAGDGPEEAAVDRAIERHGIGAAVLKTGRMSEGQVCSLLDESHIYISISEVDGVSVSLLQALDSGVPALVMSDVGCNREVVSGFGSARVIDDVGPRSLQSQIVGSADRVRATGHSRPSYQERLAAIADWSKNMDAIAEFCRESVGGDA